MFPTSGEGTSEPLDRVLDQLRIGLLAAASSRLEAARNPGKRCRSTGAPRPHRNPRGTNTAA
jgi:hypothetical protein